MSALNIPPGDAAGNNYRSTGEITAAEGEAYRFLATGMGGGRHRRGPRTGCWRALGSTGVSTWIPGLSAAIVAVTACLLLIRGAFRTLWGCIADADAHDGGRPQDLHKACVALSGALEAVTPGAVDGPEWVDRSPVGLSPRLVAVIKSAHQLMEYARRRKLLKVCPTFDGIPLAACKNAPSRPEGDKGLRGSISVTFYGCWHR